MSTITGYRMKVYEDGTEANYMNQCHYCPKHFFGHKYDRICPSCDDALRKHNQHVNALNESAAKLQEQPTDD
jgi:rRNA maturation endonuclease Nob1